MLCLELCYLIFLALGGAAVTNIESAPVPQQPLHAFFRPTIKRNEGKYRNKNQNEKLVDAFVTLKIGHSLVDEPAGALLRFLPSFVPSLLRKAKKLTSNGWLNYRSEKQLHTAVWHYHGSIRNPMVSCCKIITIILTADD